MDPRFRFLEVARDGAVVTVLLNNPPLNLLSQPVKIEMITLLGELAQEGDVRAVIVAGATEKAFSAGADMREWADRIRNRTAAEDSRRGQLMARRIVTLPQPVIAAIRGFCLGGGVELALACDFRIAGRGARLGTPEVKRGVFPGMAGSQLLPRLVGRSKAKELMMLGEILGAEEARDCGLVDRVVDDDQVMTAATEMAHVLAGRPANAVQAIKRLVNEGADLPLEDGFRLETALFERIYETEDVREGLAAFFEKREARFSHRRCVADQETFRT